MADVPHFAYPFRRPTGGHVVEVDQDSADEISACIVVILSYPIGFIDRDPTFGVEEQAFDQVNVSEIRAALAEWESRVGVEIVVDDSQLARFVEYVEVQVPSSEG